MPTSPILLIGLGLVSGLFLSLLIRVRLVATESIEQMVNKRALELVRKALSHFDPICKFEDETTETESDDAKEDA